jgi:hypothetical protein
MRTKKDPGNQMSNAEKKVLVRNAIAHRMETKQAERGSSFLATKEDGSVQVWSWYKKMSKSQRGRLAARNRKLVMTGQLPLIEIQRLKEPILIRTMTTSRTPKNSKEWKEKRGIK